MKRRNRRRRSLSRAKAFLTPFFASRKNHKALRAVYKSCSQFYNLELSDSGFSKKFSDLGISADELNEIIDFIQIQTHKIYSRKKRELTENAYDLITMVML